MMNLSPKTIWLTVLILFSVWLSTTVILAQEQPSQVFLPLLSNGAGLVDVSPTATIAFTNTPTSTSTPTLHSVPTGAETEMPTAEPTNTLTLTPTPTPTLVSTSPAIPTQSATSTATPSTTPTPTSTSTSTPTPTATPSATATPTTTPTPTLPDPTFDGCQEDPNPASAPNYPVRIVTVLKRANPEVVRLRNESNSTVDLTGWRMCSITGNQEHLGISGNLAPGATRDFPYPGPGFIWNNNERDDGALYNAAGQLVSYWLDQ